MCLRAEQRLLALTHVLIDTNKFVFVNGRWPDSWVDLQSGAKRDHDDWSNLASMVDFDFSATLDDIARDETRVYQAIKPNGICYMTEGTKHRYQSLVYAARFQRVLNWMD